MQNINFKYSVHEKPKTRTEYILLSIQHVFAMFGSTILVPTLIGIDISTSLFTAGVGTLIYSQVTQRKVPVFIGSSFAYIAILSQLNMTFGPNGIANAVMSVGIIYVIVALIVKMIGNNWVDKVLPPIVIGPTIIVICLWLAPTAISNSGLSAEAFDPYSIVIAL
ncbi:MAG: solute carrier family 23 protein, partial [Mycoplasmatales bacterium]